MLDIKPVSATNPEKAAEVFFRDGFVALNDVLSPDQLAYAQEGAHRVVDEQMAEIPLEDANRGFARYSFGSQIHHPEWAQLVELPSLLPILDEIWGTEDYTCSGGGGDYSTPGAKIQKLHSDMGDMLKDPLGQINVYDLPTPFIVVNFLMTEFKEVNGAIRFIPGTQRTRVRPPNLENEPDHWKQSIVCAPAGTALLRDVRTWHGGTANRSNENRIMVSTGYYASWFKRPGFERPLPLNLYRRLSERGRRMCQDIVNWEAD
jgi:ectoine hydroxylase-related dioxygenase (phytanoyl-CoA dioxygenase family)